MTQQTLLMRCKQTIQTLNEVILSHKNDIGRLESQNKAMKVQLQSSESARISSMEQLSRLKRKATQEKAEKLSQLHKLESLLIDANSEVENHRVTKQSLDKRVTHYQRELKERSSKQQQLIFDWESQIRQLKHRLATLERQNQTLQDQKGKLSEDTKIYKKEVQELKVECESMNVQMEQMRGNQGKSNSYLQKQLLQLQSQNNQYLRVITYMQDQKSNFIHIVDKQRIAIEEYKQMLDRMHFASRSLHTEPVESAVKVNMSAKKKSKTYDKLLKIQRGVRRVMQELQF